MYGSYSDEYGCNDSDGVFAHSSARNPRRDLFTTLRGTSPICDDVH
jgi:hypothetical protein